MANDGTITTLTNHGLIGGGNVPLLSSGAGETITTLANDGTHPRRETGPRLYRRERRSGGFELQDDCDAPPTTERSAAEMVQTSRAARAAQAAWAFRSIQALSNSGTLSGGEGRHRRVGPEQERRVGRLFRRQPHRLWRRRLWRRRR